jgi:DNA-binding transcriptional LysR family regulator
MGSLELRQLEYFVAVAEHLHFGRAADALSIGQPAVSQQVARLERILGIELLERTTRKVRLSENGVRFLPRARAVLAAADRARQCISSDRGTTSLRLGTCVGMGDRLSVVLGELAQHRPETPVELISTAPRSSLERVAAGQLDAAFVRGDPRAAGVDLVQVWEDPLIAVLPAGHELCALDCVSLTDLTRLPLSLGSRRTDPVLVDLVLSRCVEAGAPPRRLDHHDAPTDTLLAAVASGAPSWTVMYASHARMLRSDRVEFRRTYPEMWVTTSLAVPRSASSRDMAPLVDACLVASRLGSRPHQTTSRTPTFNAVPVPAQTAV